MTETVKINQTSIKLVKDDLTAMDVEAIAFYARTDLKLGSGYGNAISTRGGPAIKKELDEMGQIEPLTAVRSGAGNLNTRNIIHAAGPVFQEKDIAVKLKTTLENALKCTDENGIKQLALPLMGGGFYGIEINTCIELMYETIAGYAANSTGIEEIIFVANDPREFDLFKKHFEKLSNGVKV